MDQPLLAGIREPDMAVSEAEVTTVKMPGTVSKVGSCWSAEKSAPPLNLTGRRFPAVETVPDPQPERPRLLSRGRLALLMTQSLKDRWTSSVSASQWSCVRTFRSSIRTPTATVLLILPPPAHLLVMPVSIGDRHTRSGPMSSLVFSFNFLRLLRPVADRVTVYVPVFPVVRLSKQIPPFFVRFSQSHSVADCGWRILPSGAQSGGQRGRGHHRARGRIRDQ